MNKLGIFHANQRYMCIDVQNRTELIFIDIKLRPLTGSVRA